MIAMSEKEIKSVREFIRNRGDLKKCIQYG